jgi:hypothetical protein
MKPKNLEALTPSQQRFLEGYAAALQDLQLALTGDNFCSKHYDPMTCEATIIHSYAFNMKDGGRHHEVSDYESLEEIQKTLMEETLTAIKEHFLIKT